MDKSKAAVLYTEFSIDKRGKSYKAQTCGILDTKWGMLLKWPMVQGLYEKQMKRLTAITPQLWIYMTFNCTSIIPIDTLDSNMIISTLGELQSVG